MDGVIYDNELICEPDVIGRFDLFRWFDELDGMDEITGSVDG